MARLNEPPVSTDSIETLRRKFLRQNRDIARVNSAQSLRIRSLESECGRLLSENLTLNGRILELESELENSKGAQKIADHALEIKAKMEAQLIEWGAMLSGLGLERPTKRQAIASPGGTRLARRRTSVSRSPAAKRRPRDSRSSEEAAALLEGRMPTIQEDKSYSRRTMSHEEVLAICYNTADTNESPDLGPPPTSRFVEDDPVKVDSPTKSIGLAESSPKIKEQALPPTAALSQPLLSQPVLEPKKKSATVLETSLHGHSKPAQASDSQARPSVKAGSKRKFGDENDDDHVSRAFADSNKLASKSGPEKPLAVRDLKNRRSAKDLSARFDSKDTQSADAAAAMRPRKPLADKSTNDDLTSPKKLVKSATTGDLKKVMTEADPEATFKTAPLKKKRLVPIKLSMPPPAAPPVAKIPQEPETPSADPGPVFPDTPETRSASVNPRDTPPPADISSYGETSRPSRRARASVSYAEPNLRDKMRRPTKELLDAVSGEGKYRRASLAHPGALTSASKASVEGEHPSQSSQLRTAEAAIADEAARRPIVTSPLLQREPSKEISPADLPSSVVTERRRRPSSRHSQLFEELDGTQSSGSREETVEEKQEVDPYEFQDTSSSVLEPPRETTGRSRAAKGSRRSTAVDTFASTESNRPSRKRASMAPSKRPSMLDEPADADSSYEASVEPTKDISALLKDRVSRRRSMMI